MVAPAKDIGTAFLNSLNIPAVIHQVIKKDATKLYKLTELASATFKTLETFAGMEAAATFHTFTTTVKYTGKLIQSEQLFHNIFTGKIFKLSDDPDKAGCHFAQTDYMPEGDWTKYSIWAVKMTGLTVGSTMQAYIIGKKILFPTFFSLMGTQFVKTAALTAAKIGGNRAASVAVMVTKIGAKTVKNYGLLIFLTIEAYQVWHRYQAATENTTTNTELALNFATCAGKVLILASITIFNAPAAVVIGVSLVVCWIDLTDVYQKSLMDAAGKQEDSSVDEGSDSDVNLEVFELFNEGDGSPYAHE